jgi:hypothetical protein
LRSSIVIAQFELQTRPAAPWGFRFWQMLTQVLRSQLTAASAGGANMTECPQTSAANMNASDNRRVMDDLPQIKIFKKRWALLKARFSLSKARPFVNGRLADGLTSPLQRSLVKAPPIPFA